MISNIMIANIVNVGELIHELEKIPKDALINPPQSMMQKIAYDPIDNALYIGDELEIDQLLYDLKHNKEEDEIV